MDKVLTTILLIIASMVTVVMVMNAVYPAIVVRFSKFDHRVVEAIEKAKKYCYYVFSFKKKEEFEEFKEFYLSLESDFYIKARIFKGKNAYH